MKQKKWVLFFLTLCIMVFVPGKQAMAAGSIQIDGYFDDWESVPKAKVGYGSHNGWEEHEVALLTDGEYLYGYVRMSGLYGQRIPIDQYWIMINGRAMAHAIRGCNADGTPNHMKQLVEVKEGIYKEGYAFFGSNWEKSGDVAICITEGRPNDTLEFAMSLKDLERLYGFKEGTLTGGGMARGLSIQMWNPNLGDETVGLAGTSTGTFVGLGLCLATVGGVWIYRKKGKQRA